MICSTVSVLPRKVSVREALDQAGRQEMFQLHTAASVQGELFSSQLFSGTVDLAPVNSRRAGPYRACQFGQESVTPASVDVPSLSSLEQV